jgi:hypothetical protein
MNQNYTLASRPQASRVTRALAWHFLRLDLAEDV